jgi:peptide/nickel transport system permease protein
MTSYLLRRVLGLVPVLLGVSFLIFSINRIIPSNPAVALLGEKGTVAGQQQLAHELGLDKPLFLNRTEFRRTHDIFGLFDSQYFTYMGQLVTGDLGKSFFSRSPVIHSLAMRFPATFELTIAAMLIATILGIPLGVFAALRRGTWVDTIVLVFALSGVSFPIFWFAIILIYAFSVHLGWLPPAGRLDVTDNLAPITGLYVLDALLRGQPATALDALKHLVLPGLALGSHAMALIVRMTRSSMLDVLKQDYVRTAESKGLRRWMVVAKHALRNALLPITTVVGLSFGSLLSGAILIESIFTWPGIGSWLYDAISQRDYPVIQGGVLFVAFMFVVLNLLIDLSYSLIDPRIRYS